MTGEYEAEDWKYREFTITGKIYSGNDSHAHHQLFWALRNSESDSAILINDITVAKEK